MRSSLKKRRRKKPGVDLQFQVHKVTIVPSRYGIVDYKTRYAELDFSSKKTRRRMCCVVHIYIRRN